MSDDILGPWLAAPTDWHATTEPLTGKLADILRAGQWDVNKMAHYLPVYEKEFQRFTDRPVRMLEIGVNLGGSLELWRKYFPHVYAIVGIDYNEKCMAFDQPDERIFVRIGKQQDHDFLARIVEDFGPFDIILDDGSHIPSFTLKSFQYLFPNGLADDGVYLVEDLHACYHPGNSEPFPNTPDFDGANDGSPQFVHVVNHLIDVMHAHYLQTPTGEAMDKYEPPNPAYQPTFTVPYATTIIDSIEMHNDIVAIRRGHSQLPRMIRRWSRERMALTRPPRDADEFLDRRHPFLGEADRLRRDWI